MTGPASWNLELDIEAPPDVQSNENNTEQPSNVLNIDAFIARRKATSYQPQQQSAPAVHLGNTKTRDEQATSLGENGRVSDLDLDGFRGHVAYGNAQSATTTRYSNVTSENSQRNDAVRQPKSVLDYAREAEGEVTSKDYKTAVFRELNKLRNEKLKEQRKAFKAAKLSDGDQPIDEDARFDDSVADESTIESMAFELERSKGRKRAIDVVPAADGDSLFATAVRPRYSTCERPSVATAARECTGEGESTLANLLGRPTSAIPSLPRIAPRPAEQLQTPQPSSNSNIRQPILPNGHVTQGGFRSALNVGLSGTNTNEGALRRQPGTNLRRLAAASNRDRFAFVTPFARDETSADLAPPVACALDGAGQAADSQPENEHERMARELIASNARLRAIEPKLIESIVAEILDNTRAVTWSEIAGLTDAKRAVREAIVLPLCNPRLFEAGSIRAPPRGVLLFGPPGNGKTLIGKCVASQVRARFFAMSSSTLTSKWVGDGEKLVRALFLVAAALQPSVIFIDEIDALLSKRNDTEHESSRRMKTEFLIQMDGVSTNGSERVLVIGATNRPDELDEAARRRFPKRIYVPLPDLASRKQIVERLLSQIAHSIESNQLAELEQRTNGFSAADLTALCREAAMYPIRDLASNMCDDDTSADTFKSFDVNDVRPVSYKDMLEALARVKPTVSASDLTRYETWNAEFGMLS